MVCWSPGNVVWRQWDRADAHNTLPHSTAQHTTPQYRTPAQQNETQHSVAQHNTGIPRLLLLWLWSAVSPQTNTSQITRQSTQAHSWNSWELFSRLYHFMFWAMPYWCHIPLRQVLGPKNKKQEITVNHFGWLANSTEYNRKYYMKLSKQSEGDGHITQMIPNCCVLL